MKPTIILVLSTLIITVFTFSCKNGDENSNPSISSSSGDYYLTVKNGGEEFKATSTPLVSYGANITPYYIIEGMDNEGARFILSLKSPTSTGTFPTGTDENAAQQVSAVYAIIDSVSSQIWSTRFSPGAGTITISQNTNTNIKGTFSFIGINPFDNTTKVFTQGIFNAKKQ